VASLVLLLSIGSAGAADGWIRENLAAAQEEARKTGKPIFAVIRCER
jgi:hypothetical protein